MTPSPTFARRVFFWAGIYGLLVLLPQYFQDAKIGRLITEPLAYPEQFYGFVGCALAWQLAFLVIARDVARYRLLMLPAIVEKLAFSVPVFVLYAMNRVPGQTVAAAGIDFLLGLLFAAAYLRTAPPGGEAPASAPAP
jgi:hypothetical protein